MHASLRIHGPLIAAAVLIGGAVTAAFAVQGERAGAPEPVVVATAREPQAFTVRPRMAALEERGTFPCSECHDASMPADGKERALTEAHEDMKLVHGGGRFWCFTCHHDEQRDALRGLKGQAIGFDESHLLCGQCHFQRQRDFTFGAHGKRVGTWRGDRVLEPCTACHDAHDPKVKQRQPYRAERLREGLLTHGPKHRSVLPEAQR